MIEVKNGTLLIAEPFLKDPNFKRNVVLICRHETDNGSFGFTFGKVSDYVLEDFFPGMAGIVAPIYEGGPVHKNTLHYIHQYPQLVPECQKVAAGIYWGGDFDVLRELLITARVDTARIKFFLGYSGWSQGQLENELKGGSWITMPANKKLVFDTPDDVVWKACLQELGGDYRQLVNYPTDPQLN